MNTLDLVRAGQPVCTIVVVGAPGALLARAAQAVAGTVRRWSGVELPVVQMGGDTPLPAGPAVVLATPEALRALAPTIEERNNAVMRAGFTDPHGFACVPMARAGHPQMLVVGRTARGVFDGAVYLRDFLIDGSRENLSLSRETVVRSPQMAARGAYNLTNWGYGRLWTARDWMTVFDSFARDGMERIYFWVSGHFPSQKFPQTYARDDHGYDTTVGTRIGTLTDLRRIIRYAHELDMKLYLGSGIGGWTGSIFITEDIPETIGPGKANGGLCPSHPVVRERYLDYFEEMIDALPEADGFFLEIADEYGECQCPTCQQPVDEHGSKQYGRSEITLLHEIAQRVWRKHPDVRFCWTIGYAEHTHDVAYYEAIRHMRDPRFEWMEGRESWELPGPGGQALPLSYFSRQAIHWDQFYRHPLETLTETANRVRREGLYGYIPAFEPGFGTGDYYNNGEIPYPTHLLPYLLLGFAYRELTWDPPLTVEGLRERVQRRFFGREASAQLGRDLWDLRELIRSSSRAKALAEGDQQALAAMERRVCDARSSASPKTEETLALMQRAIDDTRKHFGLG